MGTLRMGPDSKTSVCDPTGRFHDIGNLYAADFDHNAIYEIVAGSGTATLLFSGNGLSYPDGLTIDPAGNLYVTTAGGTSAGTAGAA